MKHPQHDNLIIAANDKDALFETNDNSDQGRCSIGYVLTYPNWKWKHVKPPYKYQHVKDAWEKDKSLVVQFHWHDEPWNNVTGTPKWSDGCHYRIKPKTITKRLYAHKVNPLKVAFLVSPEEEYTIPINGTDTEVECE